MDDEQTRTYEIVRGTIGRMEDGRNKVRGRGQKLDLSDTEAKHLKDRVRLIATAPTVEESESVDEWSTYLNETSVSEVVSFVESPGTAIDDVRAIKTAEIAGKGRVTILRAADKRLQDGQ